MEWERDARECGSGRGAEVYRTGTGMGFLGWQIEGSGGKRRSEVIPALFFGYGALLLAASLGPRKAGQR